MRLLCEGKSYREITNVLEISRPTLRSHLSLIYKKLGVTTQLDAVTKIRECSVLTDN